MRREKGIKASGFEPATNAAPALFRPPSPIIQPREEIDPNDRPIPIHNLGNKKKDLFTPRVNSPPMVKGKPRLNQAPVQQTPPKPKQIHLPEEDIESPPKRFPFRRDQSPPIRVEPVNIENHPVIQHLKKETALAKQEASQARKGWSKKLLV
jgi:hypothetical protein